MNLLSALANTAWLMSNWPEARRFRRGLATPAHAQEIVLSRLLKQHSDSAYGQAHGFAGIHSYEEFARRVPLLDYAELEPWIHRIRRGELKVLTSDPVEHLIPTSGSTGARKLIPFTAGLQSDFNCALAPWIADLFRNKPGLIGGPAYWSISPSVKVETDEPSAVPIGFESDNRYLGGFRQRLVDTVMAAPAALRLVTDMESFRHLTLLCLLRCRELRLISVWHPSFLSLLLDSLPRHWNELLDDLRRGSSGRTRDLPPAVRHTVSARPMRERVAELERADPTRPETLWPSLKVISCWSDAHAEPAACDLQRRFPSVLIQPKGLLATEAFVTIPFACKHPLAIRSHFFEFLDDTDAVHRAHELKVGTRYQVIVTTSGGLWRYRLQDLVEVTGFVGQTPSLRFLGKSGNVSDRCGEKLAEGFVSQAIRETTTRLGISSCFTMLAPEEVELGWRYVLYLEGIAPEELAASLEAALRANPHYAWCRDLGQLHPIRVESIESGGYETFVTREMAEGRCLGEIKPTALSRRTGWQFKLRYSPAADSNSADNVRGPMITDRR